MMPTDTTLKMSSASMDLSEMCGLQGSLLVSLLWRWKIPEMPKMLPDLLMEPESVVPDVVLR